MNNEFNVNPFVRVKLLNQLTKIIDNHEKVVLIMINSKSFKEKFYVVTPKRFTYHDEKFFIEYIEVDGTTVEVPFDQLSENFIRMGGQLYYYGAFANQVDAAYKYNELVDKKKEEMGVTGIFIFNKIKKFAVD